MVTNNRQGPPAPGPWVEIHGRGMHLQLRIDDDNDREILRLHLEAAERRRFGRAT